MMQTPPPFSSFTHIRYWPTWLGISLLILVAWMPFSVRYHAGQWLGMLTWWLARERRYITNINIATCFPELDKQQQHALAKQSFCENGIGLIEAATGWVRKPGTFRNQTTLIGLDKLKAAQARGKGILLIGAHYSSLDFGANLLSLFHPIAVTYRPHRNALFDAFMLRGRLSNCNGVFDRNDIRGAFRHLKQGKTLWYAPDQDYGPDHAVYAPFFGRPAATITAGSRFAAFNDSPAFLMRQHRKGKSPQYEIEFTPFPDTFPSEDNVADATLVNHMLEQAIRHYPAQYLWMHKRLKTNPGGKPESPYINITTPNRRLTEAQYDSIITGATQVAELHGVLDFRLPNGLWVRQYPRVISKRKIFDHPARTFDMHAKNLRMHGIDSITIDNFFRVPDRKLSLVSYFVPEGKLLSQLPARDLPLNSLAAFMAQLHAKGFTCKKPVLDLFIITARGFAILDPTDFIFSRKPPSLKARRDSLIQLSKNLNLSGSGRDNFFACYADKAVLALSGMEA
jgi:KDO2-lipid IV(A) lauroyltransferase